MPDLLSVFVMLGVAVVAFVCGLAGIVIGLYTAHVRVGWSLGLVAIVIGVLAPAVGLVLLRGQLEPWCYLFPFVPIVPGLFAVLLSRKPSQRRGFPVVGREV